MGFDLKKFSSEKGLSIPSPTDICNEAWNSLFKENKCTKEDIKNNFDALIPDMEKEAYDLYLKYEKQYCRETFQNFVEYLIDEGNITSLGNAGSIIGKYFLSYDRFFLSLSQSRRSRAGKTFENIIKTLFKSLDYPFDEQEVINGKPDFLMPSRSRYDTNPMDCLIFTAKRTLRERWRQIVTEGTRGLGFYLATIDTSVSTPQLTEMLHHRIYLVVPESIKISSYPDAQNVISFREFFRDHLDPKMYQWKRNDII